MISDDTTENACLQGVKSVYTPDLRAIYTPDYE